MCIHFLGHSVYIYIYTFIYIYMCVYVYITEMIKLAVQGC